MRTTSRLFGAALLAASAALFLLAAPAALASAHGQLLRLAANANRSTNWFGYVQGTLEQGGKQFNSIGGDWTVPSVAQHTPGQEGVLVRLDRHRRRLRRRRLRRDRRHADPGGHGAGAGRGG